MNPSNTENSAGIERKKPEFPNDGPKLNESVQPHAIARISVDGLFGQYDYELPSIKHPTADLSRLFILYGENGSGKTTLLKLIYHALSPEMNQGHRSFLARTRFKRLALELYDGTVLEIDRRVEAKGGSLLLTLHRASRTIAAVELEVDEQLTVPGQEKLKQWERLQDLLKSISELGIRLYYLSDDRKHQGELRQIRRKTEAHSGFTITDTVNRILFPKPDILAEAYHVDPDEPADSLRLVMHKVVGWVQHQVRSASTKGQGDVHSIYSRVISDISHSLDLKADDLQSEVTRLTGQLKELERTSAEYANYGLTPQLPVDEIVGSFTQSVPATAPVLYNVMKPYVDGVKARLTALEDIYTTIHRFIETINDFYRNKHVSFSVEKGFLIRSGKEKLYPGLLSSGERQLFLLLCNTILARGHASLFLIDEPELSLNVKWQRQLVQSLLDNAADSKVQFLLASHSMELITQHRSSVVRLGGAKFRKERKDEPREESRNEAGET